MSRLFGMPVSMMLPSMGGTTERPPVEVDTSRNPRSTGGPAAKSQAQPPQPQSRRRAEGEPLPKPAGRIFEFRDKSYRMQAIVQQESGRRRQARRVLDDDDDDDESTASTLHVLDDSSSSDEEPPQATLKHDYAALGINPDLPLDHPLNRLHPSHLSPSPTVPFNPIASPPAPSGVSPFSFQLRHGLTQRPPPLSTAHKPLIHPGLLGVKSDTVPLFSRDLSDMDIQGMGVLAPEEISSSPFMSPELHSRLSFRMSQKAKSHIVPRKKRAHVLKPATDTQNAPSRSDKSAPRADSEEKQSVYEFGDDDAEDGAGYDASPSPDPSASPTSSQHDEEAAEDEEKEEEESSEEEFDAVAQLLNSRRRNRPKSPVQRVTGTHQLRILYHEHAIHSVTEQHESHHQEHVHQLLIPVIKAGWHENEAKHIEYMSVAPDANGDLRTADGTALTDLNIDFADVHLDADLRQFLVAYVQGHTQKVTEEERLLREQEQVRRAEAIERERLATIEAASLLQRTTEEERIREEERHLEQRERAAYLQSMPAPPKDVFTYDLSELPELPELPPSFYALEATFHQSTSAHKQDIVSAVGSLGALVEDQSEVDDDEVHYLRRNPHRWRRRSFSRGHDVVLLAGFQEAADEDEEEEEEWRPAELVDQFLPESGLSGGFANILSSLNAPSQASMLHQPSKPLASLSEAVLISIEQAREAALLAARQARLDAALATEDPLTDRSMGDLPETPFELEQARASFELEQPNLSPRDASSSPRDLQSSPRLSAAGGSHSRSVSSAVGANASSSSPKGTPSSSRSPSISAMPALPSLPKQPVVPARKAYDSSGVDSTGALKLTNPNLDDEERQRRLDAFLSAKEAEDERLAAVADVVVDDSPDADAIAAQLQKEKQEEEARALQAFTHKVLLPGLENAMHEQRLKDDAAYRDSFESQRVFYEWEDQVRSIKLAYQGEVVLAKQAFVHVERNHQRTIEQAQEVLDGLQNEDANMSPGEDARLAESQGRYDVAAAQLTRKTLDSQAQSEATQAARIDAQEEADWDARIAELEAAAKAQRELTISLRAEVAEARAETLAVDPDAPEDPDHMEQLRESEEATEEAFFQVEMLSDEKQEWRDAVEARKAQEAAGAEVHNADLDELKRQAANAKEEHALVVAEIEALREARDSKMNELEDLITQLTEEPPQFEPPPLIMPPQPPMPTSTFLPPSETSTGSDAAGKPAAVAGPRRMAVAVPRVVNLASSAPAPSLSAKPYAVGSTFFALGYVAPADPSLIAAHLTAGCDITMHTLHTAPNGVKTGNAKRMYLWADFPHYDLVARNVIDLLTDANFFCCEVALSQKPSATIAPDAKGRTRVKSQKLPFSIIEMIVPGKQTPVLQSYFCDHVESNRCFSFGGSKAMVSVEADSEQNAVEWREGLKALLTQAKMAIKEAADAKAKAEAAVAAAAAAEAEAYSFPPSLLALGEVREEEVVEAAPALVGDGPVKPELLSLLWSTLRRGDEMTHHFTESGALKSKRLFVWADFPHITLAKNEQETDVIHSQKGAVIYWCDAVAARGVSDVRSTAGVSRAVEPGHSFPLDTIRAGSVVAGKHASLATAATEAIPASHCFSFSSSHPPPRTRPVTPPYFFDIELDDDSVAQLWIGAFTNATKQQA